MRIKAFPRWLGWTMAAALYVLPGLGEEAWATAAPVSEGNLFAVLINDEYPGFAASGPRQPEMRDFLADATRDALFGRKMDEEAPGAARYRGGADRLVVLFYRDPRGKQGACPAPGDEILGGLYYAVPVSEAAAGNPEDFRKWLREEIGKTCHFGVERAASDDRPELADAKMLRLGVRAVGDWLRRTKDDSSFQALHLIQVSNFVHDQGQPTTWPRLVQDMRARGVDIPATIEEIGKAFAEIAHPTTDLHRSGSGQTPQPAATTPSRDKHPLGARVYSYAPLGKRDATLSNLPSEVKLQRAAYPDGRLVRRLVVGPRRIEVRLAAQGQYFPERLLLTWRGDASTEEKIIDLRNCTRDRNRCRREGDTWYVTALDAADDIASGMEFMDAKVEFAYRNAHFGNLRQWSGPMTARLLVDRPLALPESAPRFPAITCDDTFLKQLAATHGEFVTEDKACGNESNRREAIRLTTLVVFALLVVLSVVGWLYLRNRSPLNPVVEWQAINKPDLRFGEAPPTPLPIVGRIVVRNRSGRSYRPCRATITLRPSGKDHPFKLAEGRFPFGFPAATDAGLANSLAVTLKATKEEIDVRFDPTAIEGVTEETEDGQFTLPFEIVIETQRDKNPATHAVDQDAQVTRRAASVPKVSFFQSETTPAGQSETIYQPGRDVVLGSFEFQSGDPAEHGYAPFVETLQLAWRDGSLDESILRLERNDLVVGAGQTVPVAVTMRYSDEQLPLPTPRKTLSFHLSAPSLPSLEVPVTMVRQASWFEIKLSVEDLRSDEIHDVTWQRGVPLLDGTHHASGRYQLPSLSADLLDDGGETHEATVPLLRLVVSRSGPDVRHTLRFLATVALEGTKAGNQPWLVGRGGHQHLLERALTIQGPGAIVNDDGSAIRARHVVNSRNDAGAEWAWDIDFHPDLLSIHPKAAAQNRNAVAKITFEAISEGEDGGQIPHRIILMKPLKLTQQPPTGVLGIDFGTSAISVAVGSRKHANFMSLNLQKPVAEQNIGRNLADLDPNNWEAGTEFLPSMLCCDADSPSTDAAVITSMPGYPIYTPRSNVLGDPAFVALPALSRHLSDPAAEPKIVYSLKSWIASGAEKVVLRTEIPFRDSATVSAPRKGEALNAKLLGVSAVGALIQGYLKPRSDIRVGRMAVCYPNTFSEAQRLELEGIFHDALGQAYGRPHGFKIDMIRESDAVALSYILRQLNNPFPPPPGIETVLVYDFGAGTTDISILRITWKGGEDLPDVVVLGRMGVNVAGNHIDELIAYVVHEVLEERADLAKYYSCKIVRPSPHEQVSTSERVAMVRLWHGIRQAKKRFSKNYRDPSDPPPSLDILVGAESEPEWAVHTNDPLSLPEFDPGDPARVDRCELHRAWVDLPQTAKASEPDFENAPEPGPGVGMGNGIYLRIPTEELRIRIDAFCKFIVSNVIREAIDKAALDPEDIDVVIPSGRGVRFPFVRDRLNQPFGSDGPTPRIARDFLEDDGENDAKAAVAKGAIQVALVDVRWTDENPQASEPRLGILYAGRHRLLTEDQWPTNYIDLAASPYIELVQYTHSRPDPESDFQDDNRHYYTVLSRFPTDQFQTREEQQVIFRRLGPSGGRTLVEIRPAKGVGRTRIIGREAALDRKLTVPPWPIGRAFLNPRNGD